MGWLLITAAAACAFGAYRAYKTSRPHAALLIVGGILFVAGITVNASAAGSVPNTFKTYTYTPPPKDQMPTLPPFTPAPTPTPTPRPTPEPTPTPKPAPTVNPVVQANRDFLAGVDESISGGMIAGNPYKYVGDDVDLHCTVLSIVDEQTINAECGTDADGLPAVIVVQTDGATQLDKGQAIRVMGTVMQPMEGQNTYGGDRMFPTVSAQYME